MDTTTAVVLAIDIIILLIIVAGGVMSYGRMKSQVDDLRAEVNTLRAWKEEHQGDSSSIRAQLAEISTLLRVICGRLEIPMKDGE